MFCILWNSLLSALHDSTLACHWTGSNCSWKLKAHSHQARLRPSTLGVNAHTF